MPPDLYRHLRGQSIIELVVGLTIAVVIIGAASGTVALVLKSNTQTKRLETATNLARELSDNLRSFAEADWHNLYDLLHGSANHYYLNATSSPLTAATGDEAVTIDGVAYTRYLTVENVNRDLCGAGSVTTDATTTACTGGPNTTGVADDPSTQNITVVVTWPDTATGVRLVEYLTRNRNAILTQTDWSGGNPQEGPVAEANNKFASSTSIDATGTAGSIQLSGPAPYPSSGDLYSSVFDTGVSGGAALNTVMWQGSQPTGTTVKFHVASSNCSNGATNPPTCNTGTWTYLGPDGSATTYYVPAGPNLPVMLNPAYHNNHRYVRYKAILLPDGGAASTPRVDDVILNWSF